MKKIKTPLVINTIYIFLLELFFSLFIFKNNNILYIFIYLLESISISSIISIIINILPKKIKNIFNILLLFFILLIFLAQFTHYKFYNAIFSFYSLLHGGQVFAFIPAIIKVLKNNILYIIIFLIPFIFILIFNKKINYIKYKNTIKINLISLITSLLIFFIIIKTPNNNLYSLNNLYFNTNYPIISTKKLGLLNTMKLDIKRYFNNIDEKIILKDDICNLNNDIDNYFCNNKKDKNNNKYTGIFKDKNLIYITAESFSPLAINKDLTPTLYMMSNQGFQFSNYYTPIYYTSTSDGEYMSLTSNLPTEGIWSMQESKNNYYPYNYAEIFKSLGYKAYAYHNGDYKYYKRYLTHTNLGYNFKACGNGLEEKMNCNNWTNSDLDMIKSTINDYINEDHFITYYMTISGHLNYKTSNNDMTKKNWEQVKNLKYDNDYKGYLAANIELDKALEYLITELENNNKLDNTVIVISPDHYPYGLSLKELNKIDNNIKDQRFSINKNILIIYNNNLKEKININKYISNLDILPTTLNLFDINYNKDLLIGNDIFSTEEGIVIFNDRSWLNEYGLYDALNNKFYSKNKNITKEYIENKNIEVYNKFIISKKILKTNYYKKIN